MRTPKEFDYDLWTTKENRCMVRIKATGEECEVSRETFRLLRAEEDRLKERRKGKKQGPAVGGKGNTVLSLDMEPADEGSCSAWLMDTHDFVDDIITVQTLQLFLQSLTMRQRDVVQSCILGAVKKSDYAKCKGISPASVSKTIRQIQIKAKYFFGEG